MTRITMLLARGPGLPEGDLNDKLTLTVALTAQGHLDTDAFAQHPTPWLACRERPGQKAKRSELAPDDGIWALSAVHGDDDPLWTVNSGVMRPGELVMLRRPDGEDLLFRIVASETE